MYDNFTKEFLENKYKEIGSIRALADILSIPNSSLQYLFKKYEIEYNINPRRRARDKYRFSKQELEEKYKELKTIAAVAKYFNVSALIMKKAFVKFNISYDRFIRNKFNDKIFNETTPESFYLAGFIAADGNVQNNSLRICLGIKDAEHLQKIKNILQFEEELKIVKGKPSYINDRKINGGATIRLSCASADMVKSLKKFNIVPNKSKIYDLPEWLMSHDLVNHFIRGYFDGDGSIGTRKLYNKLRWSLVGNVWFLEKVQAILEKNCMINHNNIYYKTETFGNLEYTGNIVVPKICQFLYKDSTLHLDRKYNIYANHPASRLIF